MVSPSLSSLSTAPLTRPLPPCPPVHPPAGDISDSQLDELTNKIGFLAGLGSFSPAKKQKLHGLVDEALGLEAGMDATSGALSVGVQTALQYIDKAAQDVRNPKVPCPTSPWLSLSLSLSPSLPRARATHTRTFTPFSPWLSLSLATLQLRTIRADSRAFADRVAPSPAALRLLDVAGFKPNTTATATDAAAPGGTDLSLVHSNMAILNLVSQRVAAASQVRRSLSVLSRPLSSLI